MLIGIVPKMLAVVTEKLIEGRLRRYGHIMRREDSYSVLTVLNTPTKLRGRDRQSATRWSIVEKAVQALNISSTTTHDLASWRRRTRRPDSIWNGTRDMKKKRCRVIRTFRKRRKNLIRSQFFSRTNKVLYEHPYLWAFVMWITKGFVTVLFIGFRSCCT